MRSVRRDTKPGFGAITRRRAAEGGMSLIDVMISLGALSIAMLMLFTTLLNGQLLSNANKNRHRALQDVSALMEQIAVMPVTTIGTVFQHDADISEFTDLHVPDQRVRVLYANGNAAAVPLEYEVRCTWTNNGVPARVGIKGVRAR